MIAEGLLREAQAGGQRSVCSLKLMDNHHNNPTSRELRHRIKRLVRNPG